METKLTAGLQPKELELEGSHVVATAAAFIFKQFECMELGGDGLMGLLEV